MLFFFHGNDTVYHNIVISDLNKIIMTLKCLIPLKIHNSCHQCQYINIYIYIILA